MVVTSLNPGGNSGHSCQPIIDAAIFTWKEDHWALEASPRGVVLAGDFGQAPEVTFRQLGPDEYGFAIIERFGAQGGHDGAFQPVPGRGGDVRAGP